MLANKCKTLVEIIYHESQKKIGLAWSSVAEHRLSMSKALGLIPNPKETINRMKTP
jgi:hypothetical protein